VTDPLQLPRPAWMTEDLVLLEEQAQRFVNAEFTPHVDAWNEAGMYPREVWDQAGAAGLLCAAMPPAYGGAGSVILTEVAYSYTSPTMEVITAPIQMKNTYYAKPRNVAQVTKPSACS